MSMEQLKADLRAPGLVVTKSDMLAAIEQLERQNGELMGAMLEVKRRIRLALVLTTNIEQRDHLAAAIDAMNSSAAPQKEGE